MQSHWLQPFGSYYQISDMGDKQLKYVSQDGQFIRANVVKNDEIEMFTLTRSGLNLKSNAAANTESLQCWGWKEF